MPHPARSLLLSVSTSSFALLGGTFASAQVTTPPSSGDRVLGLDISAWQGNISQTTWNNIRNVENRQFVFIRSSRGGTTGYYNQSDPDNDNGQNTLSQRYDDPYFIQNITRATNAGMLAGSYHYGRMDIIASTPNANGIPNNGTDEANHFLQMAGAWMRPGYLLPVFDFEAGSGDRTPEELAQFAIDFSNRIYEVKGIRPAVYIGNNYASPMNSIPSASALVAAYPTLWSARWPNQANPDSIPVQTADPGDYTSTVYGPWDNAPNPADPWKVWQYASTGRLQSFNNGNSNLDFDVAHGNIEYVKDMQVPALWVNSGNGDWSALANWNSGQDAVQPVPGPGQVPPVGVNWATMKPVARLPGAEDNVDLERPNDNVTVTFNTTATVRRLDVNEQLNVTGGSLSASLTAQVGAGGMIAVSGGSVTAAQGYANNGGALAVSGGNVTFTEGYVDSAGAFALSGGNLTLTEGSVSNGGFLDFTGNGTLNVGTLLVGSNGNVRFTGSSGTGQILGKSGVANPLVDLQGGTRTFDVGEGSASTDLRIAIPLTNGNFTKTGAGTLELTGNNSAYTGTLAVNGGHLRLTNPNQLGTTGVRTNAAGSVRIDGNGLNFNPAIAIQLGGLGAGGGTGGGALENVAGSNTWSGNVLLAGTQHNQGQSGLSQIGAAAGTTLTITGLIQDNTSGVLRSWAKVGAGDVVLGGGSPNTYTNLTRVFGGRLIIEKDGALGAADQTSATASTLQLANANSVVAFRAPGASPGLNYNTAEWIFTEGGGIGGVQIDNLGGANAFAGHLGLGGPVVSGTQEAYLGVSAGSLEIKGGLHARTQLSPEARNIFKRGAGTLILSGTNAAPPTNSFARSLVNSTFTIEAGTVQLMGTVANGVNVAGVNTWKVNGGALLSLAQGGAAGTADINFNGGTLAAEASMTAANPLTFAGNGAIDTGAASINALFTGNVTGNGNLTKAGLGNLTLGGAVNTFRGALGVTGGTLGLAQSGADTSVANVNGVSITGNGKFDLADNDLVVRTTPASAVEAFVAAGFNAGDWNGTGGIVSSTAQANAWIYTLGVADNARLGKSSFSGQTGLTGAETLVMYTIYGDANLSGDVNAADFALFRAGFADEMPDMWYFGDFDYSGLVDGHDFELYLFGFLNQPNSSMPSSFAEELVTFAVENGFDPTMVPEPGSLALLAIGAGLLMRRRRRYT